MTRHRYNSSPSVPLILVNSIDKGEEWNDPGIAVNWLPKEGASPIVGYYKAHEEEMWDEEDGGWKMNSTSHLRTITRFGLAQNHVTLRKYEAGVWKQVFSGLCNRNFRSAPDYMPTFLSGVASIHSSANIDTWEVPNYSYEAAQAMWPQVESRLSVLNSIYELKDFRRLPGLLRQTRNTIRKIVGGTLNFSHPRARERTLKQLVSVATGHHLNYMFAVAPLVSDIKAVIAALKTVDQRVKQLLANEGQTFVSHYKKALEPDDIGLETYSVDDDSYHGGSYTSCYKRTLEVADGITYHASMRYKYSYSKWVREHALLLGRLDAFGLQLNPAIIWNGIRFSFIVDWIIKIQNSLESLKRLNLRPSVVIEEFCHSCKYTLNRRIYLYAYQTLVDAIDAGDMPNHQISRMPGILCHEQSSRYYVRKRTWPDIYRAIQLSGISTTEISLGASLAGSFWAGSR
jgi:hypothetical protein